MAENKIPPYIFENVERFFGLINEHGWAMAITIFVVAFFASMVIVERNKNKYEVQYSDFMEDVKDYFTRAFVTLISIMIMLPILIIVIDFIIPISVITIIVGLMLGVVYLIRKFVRKRYGYENEN
jgi:cobalamin synthase